MAFLMLKDELPLVAECGLAQPQVNTESWTDRHFLLRSTVLSKDRLLRLS